MNINIDVGYGQIVNMSDIISTLRRNTKKGTKVSESALLAYLAKRVEPTKRPDIFNLVEDGKPIYILVGTGYESKNLEPFYILFTYDKVKSMYIGGYIGSMLSLTRKLANRLNTKNIIEDIYANILFKNIWTSEGVNSNTLNRYISFIEGGIEEGLNSPLGNRLTKGVIINRNKDKLCYNTGILDTFQNNILVKGDIFTKEGRFILKACEVVSSDIALREDKFSTKDIERVKEANLLYEDAEELLLTNVEDMETNIDSSILEHICIKRDFRVKSELGRVNLHDNIKKSIEFANIMLKRDINYAIPFYSVSRDTIQYLIPIFENGFTEKPENFLIVHREGNTLELKTILDKQSAYTNSLILNPNKQNLLP